MATKAKASETPTITTETVWVTPAIAASWLKHQVKNRPVRKMAVDEYSRQMAAGRWRLNGEPIIVDPDGHLLDGQHRLYAVIQSGVDVQMLVCRGIPSDVFATIDSGRKRTDADVFDIAGHEAAQTTSALCKLIWRWNSRGTVARGAADTYNMEVLLETANTDGVHEAIEMANMLRKQMRGMIPPSEVAFVYWVLGLTPAAMGFLVKVAEGTELAGTDDPHWRLRERLLDQLRAKAHLSTEARVALSIKAWNSVQRRQKVQLLAWREGEPFPKPLAEREAKP